jgi:signal transduction histidine kinase
MLALNLERLHDSMPPGDAEARRQVTDLYTEVRDLGQHVSGISHRLHSSKLELFGLATASEMFCREIASRHGVSVDFTDDHVPATLPEGVAINLFRVLQEALSNAVKHSGASRYCVSLRQMDGRLQLEVSDDGRGFETTEALTTSGLGLVTMQERLQLVHGEVTIVSRPGSGTRIVAVVPVGPNLSATDENVEHVTTT